MSGKGIPLERHVLLKHLSINTPRIIKYIFPSFNLSDLKFAFTLKGDGGGPKGLSALELGLAGLNCKWLSWGWLAGWLSWGAGAGWEHIIPFQACLG